MKKASEWLVSQNKYNFELNQDIDNSKVISITGGKGGVGKTSVALKVARILSKDHKVLLIDCDTNLSNTSVKLGLPINNNFYSLITCSKQFNECLYKDRNFHLLSACNGNIELFESELELDKFIIDIVAAHRAEYDYVILDCPAGISKVTLNLNAYCDDRICVVTPDRSSITDSYSLIKILKKKYSIDSNHLLINKVSSEKQYQRIVKTLLDTVDNFIGGRLRVLGQVDLETSSVERFDSLLLNEENSSLHNSFLKIVNKYTEKSGGAAVCHSSLIFENAQTIGQEVQTIIS